MQNPFSHEGYNEDNKKMLETEQHSCPKRRFLTAIFTDNNKLLIPFYGVNC